MRISDEEPTGIRVRAPDGKEAALTFAEFVSALENGAVRPDDHVWSRIVTGGRWVAARTMRLYRMLSPNGPAEAEEDAKRQGEEMGAWPPPIRRPKP